MTTNTYLIFANGRIISISDSKSTVPGNDFSNIKRDPKKIIVTVVTNKLHSKYSRKLGIKAAIIALATATQIMVLSTGHPGK